MTTDKKVCLITGGSKGIGAATVREFLKHNYSVAFCARKQETLHSFSEELKNDGIDDSRFLAIQTDISKQDDVTALFDTVIKKYGRLDCLVNNAAVAKTGDFLSHDFDDIRRQFDINVFALIHCCKLAIPYLQETKGALVNIASIAGVQGKPKFNGFSIYAMTKSAVISLTESLASEFAHSDIRINCLAPSAVATDMLAEVAPGYNPSTNIDEISEIIYQLATLRKVRGHILEVNSYE